MVTSFMDDHIHQPNDVFQILDPDLNLDTAIDGDLLIEALELSLQRRHSKTDVREESSTNSDALTSFHSDVLRMKHNDSFTSTQLDVDEFNAIERTPTNIDNNVVKFDVFDETTKEYDDSSSSFISENLGDFWSNSKKSTMSYSRSISMPFGRPMYNEHYTMQVILHLLISLIISQNPYYLSCFKSKIVKYFYRIWKGLTW
jgi:hypothetical protein